MITQCSHCRTKFEISAELVESDDPRVRCGECLEVFNAKLQLVPEATFDEPAIPTVTQKVAAAAAQPAPVQQQSPAVELEAYISTEDLDNAVTLALDTPTEPAANRSSRPHPSGSTVNDGYYSPDLQIDPPPAGRARRHSDVPNHEFEQTLVLDAEADPAAGFAEENRAFTVEPAFDTEAVIETVAQSDNIIDEQPYVPPLDLEEVRAPTERSRSSDTPMFNSDSAMELRRHISRRGGELLSVETERASSATQQKSMLLPIACVLLALAGGLYLARDRVAGLPLSEPVLTTFCGITGCELPVKKDLARLELLQHRMNIHSRREEVLVINVDMVNNAPFRQPYPVLAINMSDQNGASVAERKFQPADYLDAEQLEETLLPGEPVRIRFEILDPGPEAVASELEFE